MPVIKYLTTTELSNLPDFTAETGDNLIPLLSPGDYIPVRADRVAVTVPTLTAGTIDQSPPGVDQELTVSGSNASGTASTSYQWQDSPDDTTWTNIAGEIAATLPPSTATVGDYVRREVSDGVQGPVYTPSVQMAAATLITQTSQTSDRISSSTFTFAAMNIGAPAANRKVFAAVAYNDYNEATGDPASVTIGGVTATKETRRNDYYTVNIFIYSADVPTGTTADLVATAPSGGSFDVTHAAIFVGYGIQVLSAAGNSDPSSTSISTAIDVSANSEVFGLVAIRASSSGFVNYTSPASVQSLFFVEADDVGGFDCDAGGFIDRELSSETGRTYTVEDGSGSSERWNMALLNVGSV